MITPEIIKGLYKKFPNPAQAHNILNLEMFNDENLKQHSIEISDENIIINAVDKDSPFHEIPIRNITGIENFTSHIAIVLRHSILFLCKTTDDIHVHISFERPSLWQRFKYLIGNDK